MAVYLDFRNTNTLWASVFVETLVHLGLTTAVISPGSRSTPLTLALARHPQLVAVPMLDERSASFFALGQAKASGLATVLVCTSGTAGANYFPAVIEAYESQVPLLILTADRPPELRDCASGQTIDQQRLFGRYVQHYRELALPAANLRSLRYLRQVVAHAWQTCYIPIAGPVHLNCPFRDPLAPIEDGTAQPLSTQIDDTFFRHLWRSQPDFLAQFPVVSPAQRTFTAESSQTPTDARASVASALPARLGRSERGLIIAGPAQSLVPRAYCEAIATLSKALGWPVLADGLSPLRNHAHINPSIISTYDLLLRHAHHREALMPDQVLQLGALPTSKVLRQWLESVDPVRWIVGPAGRNLDPLHGAAVPLSVSWEMLTTGGDSSRSAVTAYCRDWCDRDRVARQRLATHMENIPDLFEGKLSWLLPTLLPAETPLMIASSLPVRDVEWFWPLNDRGIQPYFSRGANGIDGTLSTALGIAHHHQSAVLLTGDLALLHDSNGWLNTAQRDCHLTILLVNNQGGGIFEHLPIAQFDPPFETFFATPQSVNFATLAAAHSATYQQIQSWQSLATALAHRPARGMRLLELRSDRKQAAQHRTVLLETLGQFPGDQRIS